MTANQSARSVQITIGGVDFTPCLISFQGSDNHLDQSGLISFTGQIVLGNALDFGQSLDDRINFTRFCRGTPVLISVANANNGLQRHPRGALRILTPKYDSDKAQLTLEVGDLIALLNFREPTDPDKAQVTIGEDKTVGDIISTLLTEAGITSAGTIEIDSTINYPLNLSGSYLQSIGKLLYANNRFGWIDDSETFQVREVNFNGGSDIAVQVGKDEIWYRRLDSSEQPATVIKAVGTANLLRPRTDPVGYSVKYGIASSVDPTYGNYQIIVEQKKYYEFYDDEKKTLQTQTLTQKPLGLVVPSDVIDTVFSYVSNRTALIDYEYKEEYFYFEKNTECKLKSKNEYINGNTGNLYSEVILSSQDPGSFGNVLFGLSRVQEIFTDYDYTPTGVISKITTHTNENILSILNGTGEDWTEWGDLDFLVTSKINTEEWKQTQKGTPGTWSHAIDSLQCLVRINPDAAVGGSDGNKTALFSDSANSIYETSNSGQLTPPAPERCPVSFSIEEENIQGLAKFKDPCDTHLKERERTYSVEFLAGGLAEDDDTFGFGVDSATNQLKAIASREGKLLFGRWKGQEIATTLKNEWFNYHPLMGIGCIEANGTMQSYLVDGASWVIGTTKALVSCDGIWLGNLGGATVSVVDGVTTITGGVLGFPYPEISLPSLGMAQGIQFNSYAYLLTTTTANMQLGMGEGIKFSGGLTIKLPLGEGMGTSWTGNPNSVYWENNIWDNTDNGTWNILGHQF